MASKLLIVISLAWATVRAFGLKAYDDNAPVRRGRTPSAGDGALPARTELGGIRRDAVKVADMDVIDVGPDRKTSDHNGAMVATRSVFHAIDADHNGAITKKEVTRAVSDNKELKEFLANCENENLHQLIMPSRLEAALIALDKSKDGSVDATELGAAIATELGGGHGGFVQGTKPFKSIFHMIDADNSLTLTKKEFVRAAEDTDVKQFLAHCGNNNLQYLLEPERINAAFAVLDTSSDGVIDKTEWERAILTALAKQFDDRNEKFAPVAQVEVEAEVEALTPPPTFEEGAPTVTVVAMALTIANVDYSGLSQNAKLMTRVTSAIQSVVAEKGGAGVSDSDVEVDISEIVEEVVSGLAQGDKRAGSVKAAVTILPDSSVSLSSVVSGLKNGSNSADSVANKTKTKLSAVRGISAVSTGAVNLTVSRSPAITVQALPTSAPTPAPTFPEYKETIFTKLIKFTAWIGKGLKRLTSMVAEWSYRMYRKVNPTAAPTGAPTPAPPTDAPTWDPTESPTDSPTEDPTEAPTDQPTEAPTDAPTETPTDEPTEMPTEAPTDAPTTQSPTETPTEAPTEEPTEVPTDEPTEQPTEAPTDAPTEAPTEAPTADPTEAPTDAPTADPTEAPTNAPTEAPTDAPTEAPTEAPTDAPTAPTPAPTLAVVVAKISIENLDYQSLAANAPLKKRLTTRIQEAVATKAKVDKDDVEVILSAGSVNAEITINPSDGTALSDVISNLDFSSSASKTNASKTEASNHGALDLSALKKTIAESVSNVKGISAVQTAAVDAAAVTVVEPPSVTTISGPSPSPEPPPTVFVRILRKLEAFWKWLSEGTVSLWNWFSTGVVRFCNWVSTPLQRFWHWLSGGVSHLWRRATR